MDRETLIRQGWTPPPDPPDYEAWRPALTAFQEAGHPPRLMPATPLNGYDCHVIDKLRAAFAVAPKE